MKPIANQEIFAVSPIVATKKRAPFLLQNPFQILKKPFVYDIIKAISAVRAFFGNGRRHSEKFIFERNYSI
jgi:hypothetical protein